ncbi:carbonyl reductase [NADPH] 3-like [Papilio machaon]|uniref:carbonyl reductase [NADPH] 3-like n=1 Tax=Papilio machaon TaxID=76193 RepID=UPI001E66387A|nr:carbonyl reductase [NADPH] 3-like [Papilio machaon]
MLKKVAVVTGSNRGIGLSIVKGLCRRFDGAVYLTSRNEVEGKSAVDNLNKLGLHPEYHQLDVTDRASVLKFKEHIQKKYGGIDILINNAGVLPSREYSYESEENFKTIDVNFKSILIIQELLFPVIRNNGRILNISSAFGHLSNIKNKYWIEKLSDKDLSTRVIENFVDWFLEGCRNKTFKKEDLADDATFASCRISKVALSATTIVQQKELEKRNISVNSMHPGLVRTDMTQGVGFYSADEAAETPLYLVLDAPATMKGSFIWHDGKVLDWYDYKADYYFKYANFLEYQSKHQQ